MTNETILPGDLVMVVRPAPCCGNPHQVGNIFQVKRVERRKSATCIHCGEIAFDYIGAQKDDSKFWFRVSRLKKLNPPAKQETT